MLAELLGRSELPVGSHVGCWVEEGLGATNEGVVSLTLARWNVRGSVPIQK